MKVTFSSDARSDLRGIALFIAEDNFERSMTFVEELREACHDLTNFPRRYPTARGYDNPDIRQRVYGRYIIYYAISEGEIRILHITHGARAD